tara:strand:+ start:392 stop:514 length:123 start_codon:yes stop_codon:yes gene_type:complete
VGGLVPQQTLHNPVLVMVQEAAPLMLLQVVMALRVDPVCA